MAPGGTAFAVDIWPELLDYVKAKAVRENPTDPKKTLVWTCTLPSL